MSELLSRPELNKPPFHLRKFDDDKDLIAHSTRIGSHKRLAEHPGIKSLLEKRETVRSKEELPDYLIGRLSLDEKASQGEPWAGDFLKDWQMGDYHFTVSATRDAKELMSAKDTTELVEKAKANGFKVVLSIHGWSANGTLPTSVIGESGMTSAEEIMTARNWQKTIVLCPHIQGFGQSYFEDTPSVTELSPAASAFRLYDMLVKSGLCDLLDTSGLHEGHSMGGATIQILSQLLDLPVVSYSQASFLPLENRLAAILFKNRGVRKSDWESSLFNLLGLAIIPTSAWDLHRITEKISGAITKLLIGGSVGPDGGVSIQLEELHQRENANIPEGRGKDKGYRMKILAGAITAMGWGATWPSISRPENFLAILFENDMLANVKDVTNYFSASIEANKLNDLQCLVVAGDEVNPFRFPDQEQPGSLAENQGLTVLWERVKASLKGGIKRSSARDGHYSYFEQHQGLKERKNNFRVEFLKRNPNWDMAHCMALVCKTRDFWQANEESVKLGRLDSAFFSSLRASRRLSVLTAEQCLADGFEFPSIEQNIRDLYGLDSSGSDFNLWQNLAGRCLDILLQSQALNIVTGCVPDYKFAVMPMNLATVAAKAGSFLTCAEKDVMSKFFVKMDPESVKLHPILKSLVTAFTFNADKEDMQIISFNVPDEQLNDEEYRELERNLRLLLLANPDQVSDPQSEASGSRKSIFFSPWLSCSHQGEKDDIAICIDRGSQKIMIGPRRLINRDP
jgi:hypothetical protein